MRSSVIVCVALIAIASLCPAQSPPPVYDTLTLPTGNQQNVYTLSAHEGVSPSAVVEGRKLSKSEAMGRYEGLIYSTRDRVFFATSIEEDGYYLFSGVAGVCDSLYDLIAGPTAQPEVSPVPLMGVDVPETFVIRGQEGQTWSSQVLFPQPNRGPTDTRPENTTAAAAVKAKSLGPGTTVEGSLVEASWNGFFALDVQAGEGYQLTLDCTGDADYDLYLLRPTSETGAVIADSSVSRVIGAGEGAERLWVEPAAGEDYLALVRYVSGDGEFSLQCEQLEGPPPQPDWTVIQDDDGERDSHWGQVTSPSAALHKVLMVQKDPAEINRAVLRYGMGYEPYDPDSEKHLGRGVPDDKKWPNLVVTINDTVVLKRSVDQVASMGWHEVAFDPQTLKQGKNIVSFTLDRQGAYFYMGIDLDADRGRSYCTLDGEIMPDTLRPMPNRYVGPGEYMVRIKYR